MYHDARDRQFLFALYRQARKQGVDLNRSAIFHKKVGHNAFVLQVQ